MTCCVGLCCAVFCLDTSVYDVMWVYVVQFCVWIIQCMLCCVGLCCAVLCLDTSVYVMLCGFMLCSFVFRYFSV